MTQASPRGSELSSQHLRRTAQNHTHSCPKGSDTSGFHRHTQSPADTLSTLYIHLIKNNKNKQTTMAYIMASHSVEQTGLKFSATLPLPPKGWGYRCEHGQQAFFFPPLRFYLLLFYVFGCFVFVYIYTPHACLVLKESRRGYQEPWD